MPAKARQGKTKIVILFYCKHQILTYFISSGYLFYREMEVFEQNHPIPFSKMLTFYRSSPFTLTASYSSLPPTYPSNQIGTFTVKDVKPNKEGESSKVKVKVRINLNGILTIASASLVEKREQTQQEKEEEEQQQEKESNAEQQQDKKDKTDQDAEAKEPPAPEVRVLIRFFFFLNLF